MKLLGLRTLIYPSDNLEADKAWWSDALDRCHIIDKTQAIWYYFGTAPRLDPSSRGFLVYWKLTEKGVDVGLAVRIVAEANPDTEIVVVSADTDLLPAFKATTKLGAKLIHIGYEYRPIASLSRAANATRTITIPLARKYKK